MAAKKKKPRKYPRKLRYKLERVARRRDEREGKEPERRTLWGEFLETDSVQLMHTRFDDDDSDPMLWKLRTRHTLRPEFNRTRLHRPQPRYAKPPWEMRKEKLPRT